MRLLADIGGTNARFALVSPGARPGAVERLPVARFPRFEDALAAFLGPAAGRVDEVAVAAAGPLIDGRVRLTNAPWEVSPEAVARVLPGVALRILNDLEAVALLLPGLAPGEVEALRGPASLSPPRPAAPMLALNLGTGFGAAVAVPVPSPDGRAWTALATEAGHMTLAPADAEESLACAGAATVEEVLSGPGHARLAARGHPDTRRLFSRLLGRIAGDLVLATGAWGGLHLCGGLTGAADDLLDRAAFLDKLSERSGVAARLAELPVRRIRLAEPALHGLAMLGPLDAAPRSPGA